MPRESEVRGHGAARIGMKDIARELGVSIGTVDRGLNGKPGISPVTRARVLAFAEQVGYTPNLAARYLQSRRPFRVSVHLPAQIALFWDALREGIREAAAPFAPGLQLEFHTYARLGDGGVALLERALDEGLDGVIVAPGDPAALAPLLEEAADRNIPVVCVVMDAPASPRLLSVSADPFTVGAVAGELLARFLPGRGEVAFVTGGRPTQDHADRLRGFVTSLSAVNPALKLGPIVETRRRRGASPDAGDAPGASEAEGPLYQHEQRTPCAARRRGCRPIGRASGWSPRTSPRSSSTGFAPARSRRPSTSARGRRGTSPSGRSTSSSRTGSARRPCSASFPTS